MGQAKLRRAALADAIPPKDVRDRVHDAVMRTMEAFEMPGMADCLYHAAATVGALRAAGIAAEMEGGAAWWAVGPEPGDVVSHGLTLDGRLIAHQVDWDKPLQQFHAWAGYKVFGAPFVVDMTFYQLPEKARLQSADDGMPLNVTIPVPPYYWGRMPASVDFNKSKLGEWNFIPVPGLPEGAFARTYCDSVMFAGAQFYRCPDMDVFAFNVAD